MLSEDATHVVSVDAIHVRSGSFTCESLAIEHFSRAGYNIT